MFGKIYETTWWGFPTKGGWGDIYADFASSILSAFTSRIKADGGTLDNEIGLDTLDESASLTMLPNAYNDGVLYSILPEDGTGDFDVVRGSGATRVNKEGFVEDVRSLSGDLITDGNFSAEGVELVTNGSFDTDSDWNISLGASYSDGAVLFATDGSSSLISQTIFSDATATNKSYLLTYEIKSYTSGSLKIAGGSSAFGTVNLTGTVGIHSTILTRTQAQNGLIFFPTNYIGSIDNISIKEVGADWDPDTGWTIEDGFATCDGSGNIFLEQDNIFIRDNTYKITYTVINYVSGAVRFRANLVNGASNIGNGTYTDTIVSNGTTFALQGLSFVGSVTNIQVVEITEDTDIPRISYSDFTYQDVLDEQAIDYSTLTPSSSALTLNAEGKYVFDDSGNAYLTTPNIVVSVGDVFNVLVDVSVPGGGDANFRYTKGNAQTILFNYTDFPDGVTEFQATVTGNDGYLDRIFYPASLNDGENTLNRFEVTKVLGEEVVPDSGTPTLLVEPQSTNLVVNSELNNVENIVVSAVAHTISFYGTGSITLSGVHSATLSGTGANDRVSLTFTPSAGTLICTDSGNVENKQVEALPHATSYIPTSGAIATRLEDVMTVDLTSFSLTSITETIDGVEQTPITSIPSTYTIPQGNINKIVMI